MSRTCLLAAIFATSRKCAAAFHTQSIFRTAIRNVIPNTTTDQKRVFLRRGSIVRSMSSSIISSHGTNTIIKRVKTKDAIPMDQTVSIQGWVRTVRKQKTLAFVEVNDGSSLSGIQCVLVFDSMDDSTKDGTYQYFLESLIYLKTLMLDDQLT